jgi:hypothetical protein
MSESQKTPNQPKIVIDSDAEDEANQKLAAAASELGDDIEAAQDSRAEERFIWIVLCLILFDCLVLGNMDNWAAPLVIGVIELVFIIALAKRLQVEEIAKLLSRFMDRVGDFPENKR